MSNVSDVASRLASMTDSIRHESLWLTDQAKRVSGEMEKAWPVMREAREQIRVLESDLALATRLLRRAVTELRGWCSYDDAETRGFLEREKPE